MSAVTASVSVVNRFVPLQSCASKNRYVFAYTITITNLSDKPFQLISRHWIITDGTGETEEVYGDGVVGEQPLIQPGERFTYTSGSVFKTEMGTMEGRYFMQRQNGDKFEVEIPLFVLSIPRTLH